MSEVNSDIANESCSNNLDYSKVDAKIKKKKKKVDKQSTIKYSQIFLEFSSPQCKKIL